MQLAAAPGLPPAGGGGGSGWHPPAGGVMWGVMAHAASQGPLLCPRVWPAGFVMHMVWLTLGAYSRHAARPPTRPHDSALTWEKPALNFGFTQESKFPRAAGEAAAKRKKGQEKRFLKTINTGGGGPATTQQDGVLAEAFQ